MDNRSTLLPFELEGQKYKQYTMAFFDVLFSSEEEW